jgi:hypothetical protein
MRHDKPSADRRARRLAHGNAVGKCINIPSAVGATLIPLDYRTKLWALWLAFAAKRRSCRMRSAGWTTTLIVDTTAVDMVVVGCRSGNQNQLIPMDGEEFFLATRLCRLQRKCVEQKCCGSLHPHTGYPSQEDGFQVRN